MNHYQAMGIVFVICLAGGLIWSADHYYGEYQEARQQIEEQQKTLAQQSGLISTLQTQDTVNRRLIADQAQKEQLLRQQRGVYQRKLRDALNGDKCGNSAMPAAAVELLQRNTAAGAAANRPVTP